MHNENETGGGQLPEELKRKVVGSGDGFGCATPADMTDDPQYQAWVESMAKHCRCAHDRPCDGVLAGGLCDDIQDDPRDDEETPSERYDREVYGDEWHTPMSL